MSKTSIPLSHVKELEARINTVVTVLKHHGEAGKNIEDIVKQTLRDYLPQKYGIETGFVRSLEDPSWQSNQIDLLLTRQDTGHPLAVLPGTKIFPLESVIGFMEVTRTLDQKKLDKDFQKVASLKHRVKRYYRVPTNVAREMGMLRKVGTQTDQDKLRDRITRIQMELVDLQPRFFYFAFATSWKKPITICENISDVGKKHNVHLHGMLILNAGYYKHTSTDDPKTAYNMSYISDIPSAFIAFIHDLVDALQTFTDVPRTATVPLTEYHLIGAEYQQWKKK